MFRYLMAGLLFLAGYGKASAQTPVWSTDVAPILYNSCVSCHRAGGIAPFSLMTYQDAFNMGGAMKSAVESGLMPPWPPDPAYSRLAHEKLLTQQEITRIGDWVNGGKPQGNPVLAPPQPTFSNIGDLPGTPDLIAKIPAYTSTAAISDVYRCFVIPSGLLAGKYISAFEAIPGNKAIVHHVLVYADTTGACAQLDAAAPGPGYTSFGGVGSSNATLLGGWVPGSAPMKYPQGFGVRLPPHADIILQIHYPAGTSGLADSTEVHFFFSTAAGVRPVSISPVLNHGTSLINGPLVIPANQTKTFTERFDIPSLYNISLLGIAPHMHLLGQNITSYGVTPANDTQQYIRVNKWDFHWQGFYMFQKLQKVPGGTKLYANAFYDNTTNNPANPSNPPKNVSAGEATTDEMMLVYFVYTSYQAGDENIVIDTQKVLSAPPVSYYHGQQLLDLYPNPAGNDLVVKYYTDQKERAGLYILNMEGKIVKQLLPPSPANAGYQAFTVSVAELPAGMYQVRLETGERSFTRKLLIQR